MSSKVKTGPKPKITTNKSSSRFTPEKPFLIGIDAISPIDEKISESLPVETIGPED